MDKMSVLQSIKIHEGYEPKPYIDPLVLEHPEGKGISKEEMRVIIEHLDKLTLTFGYGFTFLTKEECDAVLRVRLDNIEDELIERLPNWLNYPVELRDILIEMAYQLGVTGLLQFKKMISYLDNDMYYEASQEGLQSRWARQTPNRAQELMKKIKDI
jgi:lysozyme